MIGDKNGRFTEAPRKSLDRFNFPACRQKVNAGEPSAFAPI